MNKKYAVIADDLTGAMDVGMQLLKKNIRVRVCISSKFMDTVYKNTDVVIFDTETRNIDEKLAYDKLKKWINRLNRKNFYLIYKKIDSTLRGNIGKELDAVLDKSEKELIIFAPALPYNRRITLGGYHYVNGKKLEETEFARDLFSPVSHSNIPDIIHTQSKQKIYTISLKALRQGKVILKQEIMKAYNNKCSIVVIDAEKDEDLEEIAKALSESNIKILTCGSAGLFKYMGDIIKSKYKRENSGNYFYGCRRVRQKEKFSRNCKSVIVISSSPNKISKQQIEYARRYLDNTGYVEIKSDYMFKSQEGREKEIQKVECKVEKMLKKGMDLIINGAEKEESSILAQHKDYMKLLHKKSNILLSSLSLLLQKILKTYAIKGLVLLGGDTAVKMCSDLGVYGLDIRYEVEPYIPLGILIGCRYHGIPVITKAGGIGAEDTLIAAIKFIHNLG